MTLDELEEKTEKTIDSFYNLIRTIRTGSITEVVDSVKFRGTPIKYIANVSTAKGNVMIKPHDITMSAAIAHDLKPMGAYLFSKDTVCISIPPISGEDKQKAIKHIKGLVEEAKVSIRNIRKQLRKELAGSKDEVKGLEVESQKIIEESIRTVGELANKVLGRL